MASLILFNKPYCVLSQFTSKENQATLKPYLPNYPGFYVAGRLDYDSEGLLILTDNGQLQHRISHPQQKMSKTYWVQVEGLPNQQAIQSLRLGVELKDGKTRAAEVKLIKAPTIWQRNPPIRQRKQLPTSWLQIKIKEGKNRQVRRMTAKVGHPTLRLIRTQIGPWALNNMQPGQYDIQKVHLGKK